MEEGIIAIIHYDNFEGTPYDRTVDFEITELEEAKQFRDKTNKEDCSSLSVWCNLYKVIEID